MLNSRARMRTDRKPHIGEYEAKTNAIGGFSQAPAVAEPGRNPARKRPLADVGAALLAVVFQHLIAGLGQFGTILLQTGQNGEIALIDHRTAVALNVARTSRLLFRGAAALLLGDCSSGK